jgi:predicted RNA binding protein with dsRBD fold (UPF0201 family)
VKTEIELTEDILKITKAIKEFYPELIKYISEMPTTINYEASKKINLKYLQEYYNSLDILLKKYSNTHQSKK